MKRKNGYTRGGEHQDGRRRKDADNAMHKHDSDTHRGTGSSGYKMKVLKNFGKDNLRRKVDEALRITRNDGIKLNSKAERNQPRVPRLVMMSGRNDA